MTPKVFWLHYNKFGASRLAKDVWTIYQSHKHWYARTVFINVPIKTVYRGDKGKQPRAYLRGKGLVKKMKNKIYVT